MNERIEQIKARLERATKGPWEAVSEVIDDDGPFRTGKVCAYIDGFEPTLIADFVANSSRNAAFAAHARQDVPWLIEQVERLSAENAAMKTALVTEMRLHRTAAEIILRRPDESDVEWARAEIKRRGWKAVDPTTCPRCEAELDQPEDDNIRP